MLFLPFILNHLGQLTQVTDAAGIRTTPRNNATVTDTFGYNTRSELTSAQVNNAAYAYDYDNIGNRAAAVVDSSAMASRTDYLTNNLNQHTILSEDDLTDFIPEHERIATHKLELEWDFCGCGRKYELKPNGKTIISNPFIS